MASRLVAGEDQLIVAHGSSLRALFKYLEDINNVDILKLEVPNAQAIVYDFDQELNIVDKMITN